MSSSCVPLAAVLLGLLTACGPGATDAAPALPACETPSPALVARIAALGPAGFRVTGSGARKSEHHVSTWFVAVRFTTQGQPVRTGVWAVGRGLDGRGTVLAVDPVAQSASQAMAGDVAASDIKPTEGTEALTCL